MRISFESHINDWELQEGSGDDEQGYTFIYPCRCGGHFIITERKIRANQDLIPCSGCSEIMRVLHEEEEEAAA